MTPLLLASLPNLGDTFQIPNDHPPMIVMIGSSQLSYHQQIIVSSISYGVAVDDQCGKVIYISTGDTKFKTPEGLSVNSTLNQVVATGAKTPWPEPGWAYHTELPSGWSAAFFVGSYATGEPLQPTSKVSWFFKRKRAAGCPTHPSSGTLR